MKDTHVLVYVSLKNLVDTVLQANHGPGCKPSATNEVVPNLLPKGIAILIRSDGSICCHADVRLCQHDVLVGSEVRGGFRTARGRLLLKEQHVVLVHRNTSCGQCCGMRW